MVLQTIRERLTGILAFVILGILVIPFAFVGVNSYFQSGTENLVAVVDDQDITFNEFNQSFLDYRRRMQSIMGAAFDPEDYDTPLARREHLDRMIDERVLANAAAAMGLDVDDDRLAEQIRQIPAFQVDGEFNVDVYQSRLQGQGMTVPQFEAQMRQQMLLSQLPYGVTGSSFATDREFNEMVALTLQTRSFDAVVIVDDPATVEQAVSEDEAAAWYQANQSSFMTEEQVLVEYVELSADNVQVLEEPEEDMLRERFEAQEGRFLSPERRLVSHVLIEVATGADEATLETARQTAADIAERARAGEDFAELARALSQDAGSAPTGGDLGWVEPGMMVEAFENAMYALSLEAPISDPVQTGFGWHVIQLREIRPAEGMSFDEARTVLATEFMEEAAEREFLGKADRLVDVIYEDPTTLEGAALDLGLEIQTAGPFGRTGGEGIAANPAVVEAAFSDLVLLQGSVSDPVELEANHIVMLRLREHFPAGARPQEEVADEVVAGVKAERASAVSKTRAEELLATLQGGAVLADVATEAGLEVQHVEDAPRSHAVPDATVVSEVFSLSRPQGDQPVHTVVKAQQGYALVSLNKVTDGVQDEGALIGQSQMRRQLANSNASSEAWALVKQLRETSSVQVFEENLGVSR